MTDTIKKSTKDKLVSYKLSEIRKKSYFQKSLEELGLSKSSIKKGQAKIGTQLTVRKKDSSVVIGLDVRFTAKKDERDIELFGIETEHIFHIKNVNDLFAEENENEINIPKSLVLAFLNVSVSGTRGMLVALNSNPDYAKIYLPLVDHLKIVDHIFKTVRLIE